MRPASVGFQCPDDVAAANRSVPRQVNAIGGPPARRQPFVTWTLVALNVLAFVLEGFPVSGLPSLPLTNTFVQRYVEVTGAVPDEPWRILTSAFLHASIFHIGLNMLALVLLGTQLEQVLGWARYLALYLVAALGGGVAVFLFQAGDTYSLGASGAIFGLFSAFYLVARHLRLNASSILVTIGINLVLTVLIPGISLWAHLGGLVTGAVIGLVYTQVPSRPAGWKVVQLALVGGIAVLLVIAVVVRSATIA
jgi:membrane associated rhomboid family serine protease